MILKRQYGRYVIVATPSTVDCVIPHEFHGISTEVTVAESSTERLSRRASIRDGDEVAKGVACNDD